MANAVNNLTEHIKKCPKKYPRNNELRRQHKATVGKKLRQKRAKEIQNYMRSSFTFKFLEQVVKEEMERKLPSFFENFVDYKNLK